MGLTRGNAAHGGASDTTSECDFLPDAEALEAEDLLNHEPPRWTANASVVAARQATLSAILACAVYAAENEEKEVERELQRGLERLGAVDSYRQLVRQRIATFDESLPDGRHRGGSTSSDSDTATSGGTSSWQSVSSNSSSAAGAVNRPAVRDRRRSSTSLEKLIGADRRLSDILRAAASTAAEADAAAANRGSLG